MKSQTATKVKDFFKKKLSKKDVNVMKDVIEDPTEAETTTVEKTDTTTTSEVVESRDIEPTIDVKGEDTAAADLDKVEEAEPVEEIDRQAQMLQISHSLEDGLERVRSVLSLGFDANDAEDDDDEEDDINAIAPAFQLKDLLDWDYKSMEYGREE